MTEEETNPPAPALPKPLPPPPPKEEPPSSTGFDYFPLDANPDVRPKTFYGNTSERI